MTNLNNNSNDIALNCVFDSVANTLSPESNKKLNLLKKGISKFNYRF